MKAIEGYNRLLIGYSLVPCRDRCIFCSTGGTCAEKRGIDFSRVRAVAEKLADWRDANFPEFKLHLATPTYDHDHLAGVLELGRRIGDPNAGTTVMMGGMKHRREPQMREWLERAQQWGATRIGVTFWGPRELHDAWCKRPGEFDFVTMSVHIARDLGYHRYDTLFLTKSTAPHLEQVLDFLEPIPIADVRSIRLLVYIGRAQNMEHERITAEDLEKVPARVLEYLAPAPYRTERDWVDYFRTGAEERENSRAMRIEITESTIDWLEALSGGEIIADLKQKEDRLYADAPRFEELASHADPSNPCLYGLSDIELKWGERFWRSRPEPARPEFGKRLFHTLTTIGNKQ